MKKIACKYFLLGVALAACYGIAPAQKPYPSIFNKQWQIEIVPFDVPHQVDVTQTYGGNFFKSYGSLSLQQAETISSSFNGLIYGGYFNWLVPKMVNWTYKYMKLPVGVGHTIFNLAGSVLPLYLYNLPGGYFWQTAEGIKAIGATHGLPMNNAIGRFRRNKLVDNITDEGLARMKRQFPGDFIRLYTIGSELSADNQSRAEQGFFFSRKRSFIDNLIDYLPNIIMSVIFITQNTSGVQRANVGIVSEKNIADRSLFGSLQGFSNITSSISWAYELFRRGIAYADRGADPSGVGIKRYIDYSDLNKEEQNYLSKTLRLNWLNLVSPMALGIQQIPLGGAWAGNFSLSYILAPFGTDTRVNIYLKKKRTYRFTFAYHNYQNYQHYYPGFEARLTNYIAYSREGKRIYISPEVLLGWQPKDLWFKTEQAKAQPVFHIGSRVAVDWTKTKHILPYVDLGYKTAGWVLGNPYTQANFYARAGMLLAW